MPRLFLTAMCTVSVAWVAALAGQEESSDDTNKGDNVLHPRVRMETTLGDIVLELDAEKAPITVLNFVKYAEDKFYDGTIFHRVKATYMIQGGGLTPQMNRKSEGLRDPIKLEARNGLSNVRGTVAMARTNAPDSATSQFFINVVDNSMKLDYPRYGGYAVFGKVVEGMETVDAIRDTAVSTHEKYGGGQKPVVPVEPVVIKAVLVIGDFDRAELETPVKAAEETTTKDEEDKKATETGTGQLLAVITTEKGEIRLKLFPEEAPLTVMNFVNLARRGYYDGLKFHRVIPSFMIQGGDPTGTGGGGPGYKFRDEFSPTLRHDAPGTLSMANSGPGTNGSQFFITHVATTHLDDKHSIFGKVISGQDVVNAVSRNDVMTTITIEGDPSGLFEKHKDQLESWNKILDDKFPRKGGAVEQAKAGEESEKKLQEAKAKGTKTESGLIYMDITVGVGASPQQTDRVEVHCTGWLTDGTKFYSTYDKAGTPLENAVTGFVRGFTEGISSMKVGGKRTLIIPGNLGYGPSGKPGAKIPPNATLVFDVELLSIK